MTLLMLGCGSIGPLWLLPVQEVAWPAVTPLSWLWSFPVSGVTFSAACLQGTRDEVIGVVHGKTLSSLAKRPFAPLWAEGYGHQNLELCSEYMPKMRAFLTHVFGAGYTEN
jgi:hypothetical protein